MKELAEELETRLKKEIKKSSFNFLEIEGFSKNLDLALLVGKNIPRRHKK